MKLTERKVIRHEFIKKERMGANWEKG